MCAIPQERKANARAQIQKERAEKKEAEARRLEKARRDEEAKQQKLAEQRQQELERAMLEEEMLLGCNAGDGSCAALDLDESYPELTVDVGKLRALHSEASAPLGQQEPLALLAEDAEDSAAQPVAAPFTAAAREESTALLQKEGLGHYAACILKEGYMFSEDLLDADPEDLDELVVTVSEQTPTAVECCRTADPHALTVVAGQNEETGGEALPARHSCRQSQLAAAIPAASPSPRRGAPPIPPVAPWITAASQGSTADL